MAKKIERTIALAGTKEVLPALPLHDPEVGWITALYTDGSSRGVDLRTLLKEAHLISKVSFSHTVATSSFYRILLSIVSSFFVDELNGSREDWLNERIDLIEANEGFDGSLVDEYFDRWEDRFYMIHPTFPFMQDPSIVQTFAAKGDYRFSSTDVEKIRADFTKVLNPIAQAHPNGMLVNSSGLSDWQLSKPDVIDENTSPALRAQFLFEALMFSRYATPAVMRGTRQFLNDAELKDAHEARNLLLAKNGMTPDKRDPLAHDTHGAANAFRTAVNYIVEAGSLYKTLLLALSNENTDLIDENDVPEWEWDVNEYGFLGTRGKGVNWDDQIASVKSIRSAINLTHIAMLFVPSFDEETETSNALTAPIQQVRRLMFDFKHFTVLNQKGETVKMPFPLVWNPFVALTPEGKAFKQTSALSPETALSRSSIFRVAFLPKSESFVKPQPLLDITDADLRDAIGEDVSIRVLIHAGDASQDKNFADFTVMTKDFSHMFEDPTALGIIEEWLEFPIGEKGDIGPLLALRFAIKNAHGSASLSVSDKVSFAHYDTLFWMEYAKLFERFVTRTQVTSVYELKSEIFALVDDIYNTAVLGVIESSPFLVAKAKNTLNIQIHKKFKKGL